MTSDVFVSGIHYLKSLAGIEVRKIPLRSDKYLIQLLFLVSTW
jgi:hypothetical protein